MDTEIYKLLERIACALEKIAISMDKTNSEIKNSEINNITPSNNTETNLEKNNTTNVSDMSEEISVSVLIEKLAQVEISVKTYPEREEEKEQLNNLAKFMGSKYTSIKQVYALIKSNLNTQRGFFLNLRAATQKEISDSCQFCNMLHNIAFLSSYKYDKSPKFCIHATPNAIPQAINFLTGHWLEIFVKVTVIEHIRSLKRNVQYTYLINPQIILPNGNDFELDLLFLIDNELFWIEAKTGNYQNYIHKYSQIADIMGINQSRAILLLTEPPSKESISILNCSFDMTVVGVNEFENLIDEIIK